MRVNLTKISAWQDVSIALRLEACIFIVHSKQHLPTKVFLNMAPQKPHGALAKTIFVGAAVFARIARICFMLPVHWRAQQSASWCTPR